MNHISEKGTNNKVYHHILLTGSEYDWLTTFLKAGWLYYRENKLEELEKLVDQMLNILEGVAK